MNLQICLPQKDCCRLLIVLILFMSMIPISLVKTQVSNDRSQDETTISKLQGTGESSTDVPRLMAPSSVSTNLALLESTNTSLTNNPQPNYAIGSQNGTGGGNYDIYDSFNWTGI
ncbi:MAG: hypothetical protein ACFFC6_07750, partial [Promethearchaeota archaeon]